MNRQLIAATCLTPIGLALAAPALADTNISSATSANLQTSTANGGAPDNLVIASGGSVSPAAGIAVTIDSANTVTSAGAITMTGIDDATGIGGGGGFTSGITNSGTITIDETGTQTDTNGDTVVDGAFAQGSGRYGMRIAGSGPFAGTITNSGAITIKGNASGGIVADARIGGDIINSGAITVTGDDGYGIRLGAVDGRVTLAGAVSATGANSAAVALTGDVGGQVAVHAGLVATGYTATSLPASVASLTAENLLQGGSALAIGGSVGGGVLIAAASTTTDTAIDADGDGLADINEGAGSLTSFGSAPALMIGSASQAVAIGTAASAGLVINGTVTGSGVYAGFDGNAVRIGGLGQTVAIDGGIGVTGSISAITNSASATALGLASGARVASLTNSGAITASATIGGGGSVRAIAIDAGASLPSIANSGTIAATPFTSSSGAWAILDSSGTLTSVTNSGTLSASANTADTRAIDVSANSSGFTFVQSQSSSVTTAPVLLGAIVTGSGNDVLAASAGTMTSTVTTGAGNDLLALSGTAAFTGSTSFGDGDDRLTLANTSSYTGTVDFGAGANSLTIADTASFTGQLLGATANLAVAVQGGTLALTNTDPVTIGSLAIDGGTIGVSINPATGAHSEIDVAGATSITGAATVQVAVSGFEPGTTRYTILRSGTLTGSANLGVSIVGLPYLLTGSLAASDAAGTVAIDLQRKSAAALGLVRSEAAAYDAVYASITGNSDLTTLFLGLSDRASLIQRYRQMLPDHAGGVFDLLYTGARTMAPSESVTPWTRIGGLALWVQQSFWTASQDAVDTPGYKGSGYGASVGGDVGIGALGRVGLSVSYVFADIKDRSGGDVTANQFIGGAYWRGDWGGFHLVASGGAGIVSLASKRSLSSTSSAQPVLFSSAADWNGLAIQASGRASYEAHLGAFYARPTGTINYYKLHEQAHAETGGGSGYDLVIGARTSDELAATGTMALGVRLGNAKNDPDATSLTVELEGGRREILNGNVGSTIAQFGDGARFTLLPEQRDSGYLGTASASIGSQMFRFVASATAETRQGYRTISGRVALRGLF